MEVGDLTGAYMEVLDPVGISKTVNTNKMMMMMMMMMMRMMIIMITLFNKIFYQINNNQYWITSRPVLAV